MEIVVPWKVESHALGERGSQNRRSGLDCTQTQKRHQLHHPLGRWWPLAVVANFSPTQTVL